MVSIFFGIQIITDFMEKEHEHSNIDFERSSWQLHSRQDIPLQTDGSSCGFLTIQNAECIALEKPLSHNQADVINIRKKIQYILVSEAVEDQYVYDIQRS